MPKESTKATKVRVHPHAPTDIWLIFSPHLCVVVCLSLQRKAADKAEKAPKAKAKKDPKAPKRALSAYMFFSQDWRERIKGENPDAGFGEYRVLARRCRCMRVWLTVCMRVLRRNRQAPRREVEGA